MFSLTWTNAVNVVARNKLVYSLVFFVHLYQPCTNKETCLTVLRTRAEKKMKSGSSYLQ